MPILYRSSPVPRILTSAQDGLGPGERGSEPQVTCRHTGEASLLSRGKRGPRGSGDPRRPGRGCRGSRAGGRSLAGALRLGCRPSLGRAPDPSDRNSEWRAPGPWAGELRGTRAAAASAASCTLGHPPGGTGRWSQLWPPTPRPQEQRCRGPLHRDPPAARACSRPRSPPPLRAQPRLAGRPAGAERNPPF